MTIWAVVAPVVVLERPGVLAAFGRSRALVRGNGWQTFGVVLILALLVQLVAVALDASAESASTGVGIVVRVVIGVLIGPVSSLAAAVLYFELRRLHGSAARGASSAFAAAPERDFEAAPSADASGAGDEPGAEMNERGGDGISANPPTPT
jgi:hypothetical protein